MPNHRLDGLSALEPCALLGTQGLESAAVDDLRWHQMVHTAVAEINDGRGGLDLQVLQQVRGLLDLFGQGMAVIGVAGKRPGSDDQALFVSDRDARFDAELVGLAALALADALGFLRMQGIQLVLVLGPLGADALGQGHPVLKLVLRSLGQCAHLALYLSQDDPKDGPLPAQHRLQTFELSRMGISTCAAAKCDGLACVGELELDTCALSQANDLCPGDLQQAAIGGVGDGLFLDSGINDHALKVGLLDRAHGHRGLDGGLEQLFHASLAQALAKAAELGLVAGEAGFKVFLAAEKLKVHVLRPAFDDTVVAQVVGMLEIKQGHHQADRQSGLAGRADACTGHSHGGAVQVETLNDSASTITVLKNRRQVRFDLRPRHAGSQHSQRVAKINHGVKPGAEKIGGCHRKHSLPNSQKLMQIGPVSGSSDHRHSP